MASKDKKVKIAVIGMGRVGLPLALVLAKEGFEVVGVDIDPKKLECIRNGKIPFIENGAEDLLAKLYGKGFSILHEDALSYSLSDFDTIILTLGTTIDSSLSPSVSQITDFFEKFAPFLIKNQLIILRSTVTPGTTEYLAGFLKEKATLDVGRNILLAYCPERISEGNAIQELYQIPHIVGTLDPKSKEAASAIFKRLSNNILYTDPRSAELAKLFCNMYRYIDFAIGNEFMLIADNHDRDIHKILHLVNKDYIRGGVKPPGFTAGACLVKDGFFLIDKSPFLDLIAAAWRVNESVPGFLVAKLKAHFSNLANKKITILGLGFKKNIDDTRYSLSLKLKQYLVSESARVFIHDPFIESLSLKEAVEGADVVIFATNHDSFYDLDLKTLQNLVKKTCIICDIWNILETEKIIFPLKERLLNTGGS